MTTAHVDVRPHPWADSASCATSNPDLWFPERGGPTANAIAICRSCPVIAECYRAAQEIKPKHGIWAAMTPRQLAVARKREREQHEYESGSGRGPGNVRA